MELKITKATIVQRQYHLDHIILDVDLPSFVWPFAGTNNFIVYAAKDMGPAFISEHFPDVLMEIVKDE